MWHHGSRTGTDSADVARRLVFFLHDDSVMMRGINRAANNPSRTSIVTAWTPLHRRRLTGALVVTLTSIVSNAMVQLVLSSVPWITWRQALSVTADDAVIGRGSVDFTIARIMLTITDLICIDNVINLPLPMLAHGNKLLIRVSLTVLRRNVPLRVSIIPPQHLRRLDLNLGLPSLFIISLQLFQFS